MILRHQTYVVPPALEVSVPSTFLLPQDKRRISASITTNESFAKKKEENDKKMESVYILYNVVLYTRNMEVGRVSNVDSRILMDDIYIIQ